MRERMILVLSLVAVIVVAAGSLWAIRASSSWPSVEGTILKSEVREIYFRNPTQVAESHKRFEYEAAIEYEYHVEGVRHVSSRILADLPSIVPHKREAAALVARFPEGRRIPVFYDPKDAARACLIPGSAIGPAGYAVFALLALAALVLVTLGVLFLEGKLPFGSRSGEEIRELTG